MSDNLWKIKIFFRIFNFPPFNLTVRSHSCLVECIRAGGEGRHVLLTESGAGHAAGSLDLQCEGLSYNEEGGVLQYRGTAVVQGVVGGDRCVLISTVGPSAARLSTGR